MDRAAALELLGLPPGADPAEVARAFRAQRKPLLKELNKHDAGDEPPELLGKLEALEVAHKLLQAAEPAPEASAPTPTKMISKQEAAAHAPKPEARPKPGPPAQARHKPQESATGSGVRSTRRVALQPGAELLGRYEIQAHIAHRPEGDTYRARDKVRQTDVALKVIDEGLVRDVGVKARVKQGVLAASRVHHPLLARVLDLVPLQHTFLVTQELPPGENLWELVHGENAQHERFTPELVLKIAEQATHALAQLHRVFRHGALRPESIWVDEDGGVKVSDLGFDGLQQPLRNRRLSRSKLGTAYWAPEQYRDDVAVDERSDQHALASILYEALSGKPAMGRTADIRSFRRDLPRRFTSALQRALSSKPDRRFPDMDTLGFAAFERYEVEGAAPAAPAARTTLVPLLCVLAVVAGFVFSPLGKGATEVVGDTVRSWYADEAKVAAADLDWRELSARSGRLAMRRPALNKASQAELDRVREILSEGIPDAPLRATLRDDLEQIVLQLVATSTPRATEGLDAMRQALDAMETLAPKLKGQSQDEIQEATRTLASSAGENRFEVTAQLVRRQAGAARRARAWEDERRKLRQRPEIAGAFRAWLKAEAAVKVGDVTSSEKALDEAAEKLEAGAEAARQATAAAGAFDPYAKQPRIPVPLEESQIQGCANALLGDGANLTGDKALARVLGGLLADESGRVKARHVVDPEGFWVLEVTIGQHGYVLAGTWEPTDETQRLRVTVVDRGVLEAPFEMPAERGSGAPGQGDLVEALKRAPRDTRALWCARGEARDELPKPAFSEKERTLRGGDLTVGGACADDEGTCVIVEERRFELKDGAFEAQVRVPSDVLGTWLRAHAVNGLRSGSGAWMRVRTDGIAPRVQFLGPATDKPLEPGSTVTVRAIVYDSNLETLEIDGKPQPIRRDRLYEPVDEAREVPPAGVIKLRVRAVDAAGNETDVEWPKDAR